MNSKELLNPESKGEPTLDEIRAAAVAKFSEQNEQEETTEAVSVSEPVEQPEQIEVPQEKPKVAPGKKWRKEIDLGDGSGVQVFEADTKDELIEKLAQAQAHATRKIKELNQKVKEHRKPTSVDPVQKFEPKPLTEDEKFLIANELTYDPTGAVAKLFQATVGASPDEIRQALQEAREFRAAYQAQQEAQAFLNAHPEYVPCPENQAAIEKYLAEHSLAVTKQNLEIAFDELAETGLVVVKEPSPVKESAPSPARKRASVGITSRQAASVSDDEDALNTPDVDELQKLTSEQLRRRIVADWNRQRRTLR